MTLENYLICAEGIGLMLMLSSVHYVPGTLLNALQRFSHLILKTILQGR